MRSPEPIGRTFGVEEEYHLVEAETFALANRPSLSASAHERRAGPHLHPEMLTSQLEAVTPVCTDLDELRGALVAARSEAASAAADEGALILATSTHPSASLGDIRLMELPRYDRLVERFGTIVGKFNLCGCHVHVSVPDLETAVAIMTHARPYLPLVAALTGSSPFHEGRDTGYDSFRLPWLALWPQGGLPPALRSAAEYLDTVEQLRAIGLIDDARTLLWELRPSSRFPTLELRIGDVCTDVDDTVLYAGLARALVRTLGARVARGEAALPVPEATLRAARWRAARYGISDRLWSPASAGLVPAGVAVDDLLAELRPDLDQHGEYGRLEARWSRLRARGTSAMRQRRTLAATGSMRSVVRDAVQVTTA